METHHKSQVDKFKEAAREHGCDESEEAFDEVVRKISKAQPPKRDNAKNDSRD